MPSSSEPSLLNRGTPKLRRLLHLNRPNVLGYAPLHSNAPLHSSASSNILEHSADAVNTPDEVEEPHVSSDTIAPDLTRTVTKLIDCAAFPALAAIPSFTITRRNSAPTRPPPAANGMLPFITLQAGSPPVHPTPRSQNRDRPPQSVDKGNARHIRHLHNEQLLKDREFSAPRAHATHDSRSIADLTHTNQLLTAQIEHLQSDRRVCTRAIHRGTRRQLELRGEIQELERQRERDRGALKALRRRTWVPGWCWKAKIAELAMKLDAAETQARERGGVINEQDGEIVELREKLGEYR
ncbi:hypothetical protein B0A55_07828 [Friedmanniomyces simplex]|uniref:Uncharacterized protein n=1 Tax=Friedmanniomyces simplex TaxID=329884 RepID=A0A4U0WUS3_9PEZI|nr:hypothetical protein B0A55_07828 [Friedmanniomyces simplex]